MEPVSIESEAGSASEQQSNQQFSNRREHRDHRQQDRREYRSNTYSQSRSHESTQPQPDALMKGLMDTMSQDCKDVLGMLLITKHLGVSAGELNATLSFVRNLRTPPQKSMEQIIGNAIEKHVETSAQYKGLGVAMKLIGAGG